MPYVKLDAGILDSSLWVEDSDTCKVWVTMLCMAKPDGLVEATAPGIARRANLDIERTRKALAILEAPDPDSRTLADEGRRLRRVDGGYEIINYLEYRTKDHTNADRQRRHRAKLKAQEDARHNGSKPEEPDWFLEIRQSYPKRAGGQRWADARKACNARLREGYTVDELLEGVKRYAAYIRRKDSERTEFVMQAATFFGTNKGFTESWDPPREAAAGGGSSVSRMYGRLSERVAAKGGQGE